MVRQKSRAYRGYLFYMNTEQYILLSQQFLPSHCINKKMISICDSSSFTTIIQNLLYTVLAMPKSATSDLGENPDIMTLKQYDRYSKSARTNSYVGIGIVVKG